MQHLGAKISRIRDASSGLYSNGPSILSIDGPGVSPGHQCLVLPAMRKRT